MPARTNRPFDKAAKLSEDARRPERSGGRRCFRGVGDGKHTRREKKGRVLFLIRGGYRSGRQTFTRQQRTCSPSRGVWSMLE